MKFFIGVIAFLEEDHYVTPDFLWMLNLMETAMIRNLCHGCNLLSLGTYLKTWNIRSSHSRVCLNTKLMFAILQFYKSKHYSSLALNLSVYLSIYAFIKVSIAHIRILQNWSAVELNATQCTLYDFPDCLH